jgi:hypothetical protein
MSFTKTISTVAALASIFGAGAAGWKLAQDGQTKDTSVFEQKITELEKQLKETKEKTINVAPAVPVLPQPTQVKQVAPATPQLPPAPVPPQPEPQPNTFE